MIEHLAGSSAPASLADPAALTPRRSRGSAAGVKAAGRWTYLYRATDQHGQVIEVLASERRDGAAAEPSSPGVPACARAGHHRTGSGVPARARMTWFLRLAHS